MLRATLASVRFHAHRLVMSSLAIVLGCGFVAGAMILGASMSQAFYDSFAASARNVGAVVLPAAGRPGQADGPSAQPVLPQSTLAAVRAARGVAAADGRVLGQATLIGRDGKPILDNGRPGAGVNVASDPLLRGFTVASGRVPAGPGEVAVDTSTATDEHFRLGQQLKVVGADGVVRRFRLVGIIDIGVVKSLRNATLTAFTTPAALQVTGQTGFAQIVARGVPGLSQPALAARIAATPGLGRAQVRTGAWLANALASDAVHFTSQFTTAILMFAVVAVAVAAIVIYNTFRILAAQRARELALLRCVGAGRRQLFASLLGEAALTGAASAALGVAAGVGLAWGLERLFAAFGLPIPAAPLVLTPSAVAASAAVGTVVTLLAAVMPAWAATRVPPVAALGAGAEPRVTRRIGWTRIAVAVVLSAVGLAAIVLGRGHLNGAGGFVETAAGGAAFFLAVLALGPVIAPPVIALLGWLPGRLFGAPARLAAVNARRNPHRAAATAASLIIGVTLVTTFTVVASSAQASATASIAQNYPFDYTVATGRGDAGLVPPAVLGALRASPVLGLVAPYYAQPVTIAGRGESIGAIGGRGESIGAIGGGGLALLSPPIRTGSLAGLRPGTAAVDVSSLPALHVRQGGLLRIPSPSGPLRLRVAAVYDGANTPLPQVLISAPDFLRAFRPAGAQAVYVNPARGVSVAASRAAVARAAARDPLLGVNTIADYTATLTARVDQVLALFIVLLGLALVIALLGIANTLTLSVIERTRESAVLRALGLTPGQLRGMLLAEALLIALLGAALGVALGAGFGWVMVGAFIKSAGAGVLSIPYGRIALYVAVGALASLVAGVAPARRAARANVVAAMADA